MEMEVSYDSCGKIKEIQNNWRKKKMNKKITSYRKCKIYQLIKKEKSTKSFCVCKKTTDECADCPFISGG
jgi:hypothetical protein